MLRPVKTLTSYLAAIAILLIAPPAVMAQKAKPARVGFLLAGSPAAHEPFVQSLRKGLRDLGYVEGRTIVIEPRFAMGKRALLPELAADLVRLKSDVIVVTGATAARIVRKANPTIPIVVAVAGDLVASGIVASLARPGGNTTGMTGLSGELSAKKLQLLKEMIPGMLRVAVLHNGLYRSNRAHVQRITAAGRTMGVTVQGVSVEAPGAFEGAFAAMVKQRSDALIVIVNRLTSTRRKHVVALASKWKLPAMCWQPSLARLGCLMSYGADRLDMVRRSATQVHRILQGTKPGDLPVEQPSKFDLVINLKTAKSLGITVPRHLLLRADEVIE